MCAVVASEGVGQHNPARAKGPYFIDACREGGVALMIRHACSNASFTVRPSRAAIEGVMLPRPSATIQAGGAPMSDMARFRGG